MKLETSGKISYYKKGAHSYLLAESWWVKTPIVNQAAEIPKYARLLEHGTLEIFAGYWWDGPSGPAFDTKDFMRASLAHDALYQMLRNGKLHESVRKQADRLMYDLCREDGMSSVRAWWCLQGVRKFAGYAAKYKPDQVLVAP